MLRRTFIWVREVREDSVLVMLTDWPGPTELPRSLFSDREFGKLARVERFIGWWNARLTEEKLIVAGPFWFDCMKESVARDATERLKNGDS